MVKMKIASNVKPKVYFSLIFNQIILDIDYIISMNYFYLTCLLWKSQL